LKAKRLLLGLSVVFVACTADQWERFPGPDDLVALVPWFSTMKRGLAIQPYKWAPPRMPVPGTVPVTGNEPPLPVTPANLPAINALTNPVPQTAQSLERGQDRYEIYCLPCHGAGGAGDGPVNEKLLITPSLLTDRAKGLTDGYLYAYIRHGGSIMPAYGDRVRGDDRWRVVNYVRMLQGAGQ